jgi:hypothetical protein
MDRGTFVDREDDGGDSEQPEEEGDTLGQPNLGALLAAALDDDRNACCVQPAPWCSTL